MCVLAIFEKFSFWLDAGDVIGPLPCELSESYGQAFMQRGPWETSKGIDNGGFPESIQKGDISPPSWLPAVQKLCLAVGVRPLGRALPLA